jgi:hypothetical protein
MKSYPYGNASREKTVKAARLKIFEIIDKSLSELLKKRRINRGSGSWVISILKSAFFGDGALMGLRPL